MYGAISFSKMQSSVVYVLMYCNARSYSCWRWHNTIWFVLHEQQQCHWSWVEKKRRPLDIVKTSYRQKSSTHIFIKGNMSSALRPHPDDNALLQKCTCIASFWLIVHIDPENALFWKRVQKRSPPFFMWTANPHTFQKWWHHHPTPRPLASDLWTPRRLITTTTTMADYMLVFVPQKILSLSCNLHAL